MAATTNEPIDELDPNALYDVFIVILTVLSLIVVAFQVLARVVQVEQILIRTDAVMCVLFALDVVRSWRKAPDRRAYVFGSRPGRSLPVGILEAIGCIPAFLPVFLLLRLFRLVRLGRAWNALGRRRLRDVMAEIGERRADSAAYFIVLAALLTLIVGSSLISIVEPPAPGSNIKTGGEAFWWAFVTITTVGYGDFYPVTEPGRLIGMATMAVGVGILGVLTSYLAQFFLDHRRVAASAAPTPAAPTPAASTRAAPTPTDDPLTAEIRAMRADLAELRDRLMSDSGTLSR